MKRSILSMFIVLLPGSLLAADDPTKQGPQHLQGTWKVTSAWRRGEQMPAEKSAEMSVVIDGDKLTIREGGRKKDDTVTFKLDQKQKPAAIDIIPPKGDKTVLGIYELKGDELKLCWSKGGRDRPMAFVSTPDMSSVILLVMKREKK